MSHLTKGKVCIFYIFDNTTLIGVYLHVYTSFISTFVHTVDWENFIIKKVMWDKSSTRFNFIKAKSIVCTSTKELH